MATAIVTAGAGARGAYEAGVLSRVLPKLIDEEREDQIVLVGTSAGAINTAIMAGAAGLSATVVAERLCKTWCDLSVGKIFKPNPWAAVAYGAQALGVPKMHSYALLDTAPLRDTVANGGYVEWSALPSKFEGTWLKAAGVVATEVSSGKSVVFVQGLRDGDLPAANVTRGIDYRPAKLGPDHVLASAAIPIAFPSVEIAGGAWFVDGGVRLNTPIAPAIDLLAKVAPAGKNRIVIVSTDPDPNRVSGVTARPIATNRRPDILDQAAAIMYSALVDRVAEDVLSLRRVNAAVQASADDSVADARGAGQSFEVVDHCYLGPPSRGHVARQAGETFRAGSYPPWSASFVFNLISHAIGNKGRAHDELLSFLFFDPNFLRALVKMGQDDADRQMVHGRLPWGDISPPGGPT